MSRPKFVKLAASLIVLGLMSGCAATPAAPTATAEAMTFPKPTEEEISIAERADPLTRANFWNDFYNLHPTDLDISLAFIRALRDIGSDERATEVANLTAVSHPQVYEVHIEVGRAEMAQRNLVAAVNAFGRAAMVDPEAATPYALIGVIYDQENKHEIAQDAYREALKRDPNRPATLANFGLSLALIGELDAAEAKLREATALPTASAKVRQNFALILGLQGKFDEAREVAAIDAPEGVAERNTDFLADMIGDNPRFKRAAHLTQTSLPSTAAELPEAAPTEPVLAEGIEEPTELASRSARTQTVRPRLRGSFSGGE